MIKNLFLLLLPSLGPWLCLSFSDSQANTSNATDQRETRVTGGHQSQNVNASESTVNITATDYDAVAGGLNTANNALALSTKLVGDSTKQVLNAGLSMFTGALDSANVSNSAALNAVSKARDDVAAAWQNSQTPENSMLKIAGFVVVGVAAVGLFAAKMK